MVYVKRINQISSMTGVLETWEFTENPLASFVTERESKKVERRKPKERMSSSR